MKSAQQVVSNNALSPGIPRDLHPDDTHLLQERMEWLPNWRVLGDYPPSSAFNLRLAWELLRRNRYFQQDCLKAEPSAAEQRKVCKQWGLQLFKPFWENYSKEDKLFSDGCAQPLNSSIPMVTSVKSHSAQKLVIELNPQELDTSRLARDQQFEELRALVERHAIKPQIQEEPLAAAVWRTKVPRYLRLIDALSQTHPASRQVIGERFHRQQLILTKYHWARTESEVKAKALAKFPDHDIQQRDEMVAAEIKTQALRRQELHKKYSREIGSEIIRAYGLVYGNGYRLLTLLPDIPTPKSNNYMKTKHRAIGDGVFENTRLHPRSSPSPGDSW